MAEQIHIEQEFRASRRFTDEESTDLRGQNIRLQILGEDIAGDGRLECEDRDKTEDEVECSLDFELVSTKASFFCHRDVLEQTPCRDKRMPTACMQKLLASLTDSVEVMPEIPSELL